MSAEPVWAPLESNPAVINLLIEKVGVDGVECVDVFSFDDVVNKNQLALLFCYPEYTKVNEMMAPIYEKLKQEGGEKTTGDVFFMKQKITNACGFFALFHALANLEGKIQIGDAFKRWLDEAKGVGIEERSALLAKDVELAKANEEAAHSAPLLAERVSHHIVCYVSKNGKLFEIDSRAPFPRCIGATSDTTLIKDAGAVCRQLIEKLDNLSFAALALVAK